MTTGTTTGSRRAGNRLATLGRSHGRAVTVYYGVALPIDHGRDCCRLCGCTEERACPGGCSWVIRPSPHEGHRGICSACYERVLGLLGPPKAEMQLFRRRLARELNPNVLTLALANAAGGWRRSWLSRRRQAVMRMIREAGWMVRPEEEQVPGLTAKAEALPDAADGPPSAPGPTPSIPYGEVADISGGRAYVDLWLYRDGRWCADVREQATDGLLYQVVRPSRQGAYRLARAWLKRQMRPAAAAQSSRVHGAASSRAQRPF